MKRPVYVILSFLVLFVFLSGSGYGLLAFMDKNAYEVNETATIKVNRTQDVNITGVVTFRANTTQADTFTIPADGTTGMAEYSYTQTLAPEEYTLTLTQGSDSVQIDFKVASEILRPAVRLMGSLYPVFVNTSTEINNETGGICGNFTELLKFNKSATIFYGNVSNLTGDGKTYNFVVIDENVAGVYDTVHVDDDRVFRLFNDTEDNASVPFLETSKGVGDMLRIDSSNSFIVADMETTTGKMVYLIRPLSSSTFTSSDTLYMLVFLYDQNGNMKKNQAVNISIQTESKQTVHSEVVNIGSGGSGNLSVSLSGYSAGKYTILANETPVDVFKVESFKLYGKVTDLSDNPMSTFAPGSKAKIWAVSKDSSGNLMDLDYNPLLSITYPDGSTYSAYMSPQPNATGVYTAETPELSTTGEYKIVITGINGSDTERFDTGLKVQAIEMMVMTLNPKYIDEGAGPGTTVSAFAPGSNVTATVFMINMSKGSGLKSGGPPCGFDGTSCIRVGCGSSQFEVMVKDDKGNRYKLGGTNFTSMTIETAAQSMGMQPPEEPGIKEQCMILINGQNNSWLNETGNYKVEIKFSNDTIGDFEGGETFSIQRLLARGSTVDFKGDTFSFLAPNSTVRVKLEIRDMLSDELLNSSQILNAKFTEMWKEWPERKNAFTDMTNFNKAMLNESIQGDTIVFTSPPEEGFYHAEFRFQADVSGTVMKGTGSIFFELKKYMIWADLQSVSEDNWFVKTGENISLHVNIVDIDMGSQFSSIKEGTGAAATCTGCAGLIANVSSLRNEQFFKEMTEGTDYTITTGVVVNSTSGATITITPLSLPTGWYGMDIVLQRPGTSESYYGWGWFEIRNFWVDVFEVELNVSDGNYTRKEGSKGPGGVTVPVGGNTLLGVAAFSPPTSMSPPTPLKVTDVSVEGLQDERSWPPVPVSSTLYNVSSKGEKNMKECWGDHCEKFSFYLINFTTTDSIKESRYMLSLSVTTEGGGTDTGSVGMTVSSYVANYFTIPESKMYEWPPAYANSENLLVTFNAKDFQDNPRNITNVTIKEVFSEKMGRPVKFRYGQNYTNNCTGTTPSCTINASLSGLSQGEEYMVEFRINSSGSRQSKNFEFEIKNLIFSIPRIYEGHTREYSTPDKTLEAWNSEDRCDNELHLQKDDECQGSGDNIVCAQINGTSTNLTIPDNKTANPYYADRICIYMDDGGRWQTSSAQSDQCPGSWVYVVSNGTHAWINESTNLSTSSRLTNTSVFTLSGYAGMTWELYAFRQSEPNYIRIKHKGVVCARNEMGGGVLKIVPPAGHLNYSTFYHGPSYIVGDMWQQQGCGQDPYSIRCQLSISDRPEYVYHNTTHLWLYPNSTFANFTDASKTQGPVAVGSVINDGYGGRWKIISISKSKVMLKGENILENGIMVNTSLSTSGNIRIGELREDEMGFENKFSESKEGIDLDGDGLKNGTVFFLVLDSGNGYDKLAFATNASQKWNFTNMSAVIDVNDPDRLNRQVGMGSDKLTLLSIDPRANYVKLYDPKAAGDWPELGDSKIGDNVTIPVIVTSPGGNQILANVSVPNMKVKTSAGVSIVPTGLSPVEINGIGEIRVNISALGYEAGSYEFELVANSTSFGTERMNEWLWPKTTVRNFLVDSDAGYGGVLSSFIAMTVIPYGGWGTTQKVRDLFTVNDTGQPAITGVMEAVNHDIGPHPSSCNFSEPPNAGTDTGNHTYILDRFEGQYYAYMTPANESMMWVKKGDCNFTNAQNYSEGSPINISLGPETYMLYVLKANISQGTPGAIGLLNFSANNIKPLRMDDWSGNPAPKWAILTLYRPGTRYNVVFANGSMPYPQAGTWSMQEVSKVVWMDTDGDFSDATEYIIGENFTADDYISRVGPGPWEGLIVANSSDLPSLLGPGVRPAMDIKARDSTLVYFGKVNETSEGLDLNMDGDTQDVFYMVAYDDFEDSSQNLTRIYVDDDLNMTEPWWANSSNIQEGQTYTYYDFYGSEAGIPEQDGSPPKGMWGGNLRFAPRNSSQSWEESAEWEIKMYNGTKMILEKHTRNLNRTKTISLTIKAFDFAQNPLQGAEVSLVKLMRFGGGQPFKELNESQGDFNLTETQNVTDSDGYAMLNLQPPGGGWLDNADYIATLRVDYGGMTETIDNWFRIGEEGMKP